MKETKDLFSKQAGTYAQYRPVYPQALYDFLFGTVKRFDAAWDCATGNGQVAVKLAERFKSVYATDISEKQIAHAVQKGNIHYSVQRAEHTSFANDSFDLVTIGTALHWFDFDNFYKEVRRVVKDGGYIAAWAYAPFRSETVIDELLDDFTYNILKDYWDRERMYVDKHYTNIPFPFDSVDVPKLEIKVNWTREHFMGFLNSWSSVQHYINKNGSNPVDLIDAKLEAIWPLQQVKDLRFPLFLRMGMVKKQG